MLERPSAQASTKVKGVPTPKEFFGFEMGDEGKLADFDSIKRYFKLIADRSDEVEYQVVDRTTLGNDFPILLMSSKHNLKRVNQVLDINKRLSDPRVMRTEAKRAGTPVDEYARQLAAQSLPVYYIEATIHSTEVGATQSLVNVVHRLSTESSEFTRQVLDNVILLIVPSQNPDGQHLVVDHFNKTAGTDFNRTYPDLYHHYAGHDNNRDWFMLTQKESQTRVRLEQKYRPVAQHYMHQAGTTSPRIWSPPWDEPMSETLDPVVVSASNALGMQAQRDLVAEGKKGSKWNDAYGILWNADVIGHSPFLGTSTWLTEIASARDLAYTYTSDKVLEPADKTLRSVLPYDRKTWSLKQIVEYGEAAAYSGMKTVAGEPKSWLYNNLYLSNRNSETWDGGPYAYVVSADQRDPYALYDMLKIFDFGQVEIDRAASAFTAGDKRYPEGSYILRTNQPMGRWVDQLLRIDKYPDSARKCAQCPLIMPYSETTDNLGLFLGVDVDAVTKPFEATATRVKGIEPVKQQMPAHPGQNGAYVLSPTSYGLGQVIADLQDSAVPTYRAKAAVTVEGRSLPAGAVLVPSKDPKARQVLTKASQQTGLPVYATNAVPKVAAVKLKDDTRVGLIRGANNMPGGWMMWMFDQIGVNYQVVSADDYANLSGRYDTIVLAPGISANTITRGLDPEKNPQEFHWARGVPDGLDKLKQFVEAGGNLVALGSASTTAATSLGLPVQNVTPTNRSTFNVPGALLKHHYDPDVPAAWGMPESWPTWFNNDAAFKVTGDAHVASTYPREDNLLVSGYADGASAIGGAANIATFDVGKGEATIAGGHITFRTWPRAAWTVVTNAMYNGAGQDVTAEQLVSLFR
ncbi:M14 family zinc carboxypeptidase [Micromonospora viridifaciens]|uniref:M14 family zinc carboxypeptidase n=1 Tax=Micromonospora viridifaciens TaxID=1881 RepID=UPI00142DAB36|nr:M14 family zinc carboxypeptidase [Micromonospora viridifaciens]